MVKSKEDVEPIELWAGETYWGGTAEDALKHLGIKQTDKTIMTKQITLSDIHSLVKSHFPFATMEKRISFTNDGEEFCFVSIDEKSDGLNGYISFGIEWDYIETDIKKVWVSENRGFGIIITEYDIGAVIKDGDYSIIIAKPKASATFRNEAKDDVTMSQKDIEEFGDAIKYGIDWCKQLQSSGRAKLEEREKEYERVGWIKADGRALGEEYDPFKRFLYDFSKL